MSLKERLRGAVSPFAHLNGPVAKPLAGDPPAPALNPAPAPAAKTKSKKTEDDNSGNEDEDSDDPDDEGDDESDEDEMRAEDDEAGDDEAKKTKKANKRAVRAARMRERMRCAAIFSSEAAGANPALAAQLAFGSNTGRRAAIGVLKASAVNGGTKPSALARQMASVPQPVVAASGGPAPQQRAGDAVLDALATARGGKKV